MSEGSPGSRHAALPLRVLQVGMSPGFGGTEAIIYGIYRSLDPAKIQFDFLNVHDRPLAFETELRERGARVFSLSLKRRGGYSRYVERIRKFYKEHSGEFDAVVCNIQCMDQIDMARFAYRFGVKKVFIHIHNSGYGFHVSPLLRLAIVRNKLSFKKYASALLACSGQAAIWAYGKKEGRRAIIIKNGIDTGKFQYSDVKRETLRKEWHVADGVPVYGSMGRMVEQKNQLFLLSVFSEIAKKNPRAHFVLVGEGPLENALRERASQLNLDDKLIWIPRLDDPSSFYCAIDAFVFPSLFEGLGIVLVEAQCSGLPCYFSADVIPQEVAVSALAKPIPLALGAEGWAEEILEEPLSGNRLEAYAVVRNAGCDIGAVS